MKRNLCSERFDHLNYIRLWLYLHPSLLLNRELLRYQPTFLKLLVLYLSEHVVRWLSPIASAVRQRFRPIVILEGHGVRVRSTLEKLGIDGSCRASLVILPKIDHLSQLLAHGLHLSLSVHMILSAKTGWCSLKLVSWLLLKARLSDLLYTPFNYSTLDSWHVK